MTKAMHGQLVMAGAAFEGGFNRFYAGYRTDEKQNLLLVVWTHHWMTFNGGSDPTVEYGYAISNTRDVHVGVKIQNLEGKLRYSVSFAPESDFSEDDALLHFGKYDNFADQWKDKMPWSTVTSSTI